MGRRYLIKICNPALFAPVTERRLYYNVLCFPGPRPAITKQPRYSWLKIIKGHVLLIKICDNFCKLLIFQCAKLLSPPSHSVPGLVVIWEHVHLKTLAWYLFWKPRPFVDWWGRMGGHHFSKMNLNRKRHGAISIKCKGKKGENRDDF